MENNPLRNLLQAGVQYGGQYAADRIFGSSSAPEDALQVEKVRRGQINGSGPVNAVGSLLAPQTWTDFFFGTKGAQSGTNADGTLQAKGPDPTRVILLSVIAGLVVWFLVKK